MGAINKIYTIKYNDKFFSLNDLYSQGHWSKRSAIKNKYRKLFIKAMNEIDISSFNEFYLVIFYNSRHDVDNISGMAKVFVDALKGRYVKDDSKRYYKGLSMFPAEDLEHNSAEFIILSKK